MFWCRCVGQGILGSGWECETGVCVSVRLTELSASQVRSSPELKSIKTKTCEINRLKRPGETPSVCGRGRLSLLTGGYHHPLGSLCVHWQCVHVETCDDTMGSNDVTGVTLLCWCVIHVCAAGLTHLYECDHCVWQGRDAPGCVFTIRFSTSTYFCNIYKK